MWGVVQMMAELDILKSFGLKVAEYCIDIGKEKIIEANKIGKLTVRVWKPEYIR